MARDALLDHCAGPRVHWHLRNLSYAVSLRRREVALRLALGALRRSVVYQLMATSIRIVGTASAIGLVLSLVFTQSLSNMLYGVTPIDLATLSSVILLVVAVALWPPSFPPRARPSCNRCGPCARSKQWLHGSDAC